MAKKHIVRFNIKGKNVQPDKIGMGDLGDLLKNLDVAIRAAVPSELLTDNDDFAPIVSFVSVKKGNSSDMRMAVLECGVAAVRDITQAIANATYAVLPVETQDPLARVSKWIVRNGYELEFEENAPLGIQRAVVSQTHPFPPRTETATIQGTTTIWGFLLKTGGKAPSSSIVFPDGTRLRVTGDETVTKQLAERLYEDVGIEGVATWRISDQQMIAFRAIRLMDYRPGTTSTQKSLGDLATASAGRWEDVNGDAYLRELRGESVQ